MAAWREQSDRRLRRQPDALAVRRWAAALFCGLGLAAASVYGGAQSQPPKASQYEVQAVYLYDFAKFVRWPAGKSDATLDICIAGQKVYLETLTKVVAGEHIDGRALNARQIARPEEESGCDVLFIDVSMQDHVEALLAATAGKPILTVSDISGFLERGGMVQFVLTENRVRFAVNMQPAVHNGLGLSSELLKVAVSVRGRPGGGGTP